MSYWQNKVALVTGGSKGLGLAVAKSAALAGARVVIAARNAVDLAAAATAIGMGTSDRTCHWRACDVTQDDQVAALVAEVVRMHGGLDLLVNCAGKSDRGEVGATSAEQF